MNNKALRLHLHASNTNELMEYNSTGIRRKEQILRSAACGFCASNADRARSINLILVVSSKAHAPSQVLVK